MHIYCINLERRRDRRQKIQHEVDREELEDVEFFSGTDGCRHSRLNKGQCGCVDSHIRVWRDIVDKGHPVSLVLEDDARLVNHFRDQLDDVMKNMPSDWDYVNLGSIPSQRIFQGHVTTELTKGLSTTTHCYLISLKAAQHLSHWETNNVQYDIDMQITRSPLNMYFTQKPLATQNIQGWPILGFVTSAFDGDLGLFRKSAVDFDWFVKTQWKTVSIFFILYFICIRIQKSGLLFS
jgi:GR25 family glycosyltransferase involved in LPS biosynthesis